MKKLLIIFLIVAVIVFGNYKEVLAEDLCGGTGGNGEIVSIENNGFTLKLSRDNRNQVIYLSKKAEIKTSDGIVSLSDLKTGERVTLVGGPNKDSSFTADNVFVCSSEDNIIQKTTPLITKKENANYKKVSEVINVIKIFLMFWIWFGFAAYFRIKEGKSYTYLLFFTVFYIYLYKVLDYTIIQFQSLILIQHFVPNLMLNGVPAGRTINLIPFNEFKLEDVKTSLLNILMLLPFGFGLPFVSNFRFKKVVFAGLLVSIMIESLQFITGFLANTTFRIADINDLIFNTIGAVIGYILFIWFVRIYQRIFPSLNMLNNPVGRYITDRPQIDNNRF